MSLPITSKSACEMVCVSDVTAHQLITRCCRGTADAKARRHVGAGPKAVADSLADV